MTYLVQRDGALPNQVQEKSLVGTLGNPRPHGTTEPKCPLPSLVPSPDSYNGIYIVQLGPVWLGLGGKCKTPRTGHRIQREVPIFVRRLDILRDSAPSRPLCPREETARPRDELHDTTLSSWSKRPAPHAPRRLHTAISPLRGVVAGLPGPDVHGSQGPPFSYFSLLKTNLIPLAARPSCRTSLCLNRFLPSCCESRPTCSRNARAWPAAIGPAWGRALTHWI